MRFIRRSLGISLAALLLVGCSAPEGYLHRRLLDATDVIDVKWGPALGLGVKVEDTMWLGAGLGIAKLEPGMHEFYGRRRADTRIDGMFAHAVLFGAEAYSPDGSDLTIDARYRLMLNVAACDSIPEPALIDRFRVGVEVIPVAAALGIYVNFGQLFDFLAGVANFDPAGDDRTAKGASMSMPLN